MSRKIIMNLAMSIDGFIADEDGGFDWIVGDGDDKLNTEKQWSYEKFLDRIDTVVMGKNCYDQKLHEEFKEKTVFVATSKSLDNYENIYFINDDICKVILDEKKKEGKDIFLFGGGILIDSFIKAGVIDEFIIGIIPTILGKGRPLFLENNPTIKLKLEEYYVDNGIIILRYKKR
ncbi:dihydrofolate reductase family protein [Gottschalkia purinilytica]|uniref:Dihydrofolate reductase family protein n=1 Tax=Gottschalkia purinilytica TaxID=1503 RepID=A0A0L0WCF1_GOTPU|nr:dihydrofolate reductase family protein [Gottschalkia purinilytica]KNF09085.1 dihydrofolate reductase family protein [Gottschalkia purinilytica]